MLKRSERGEQFADSSVVEKGPAVNHQADIRAVKAVVALTGTYQ